MHSFLIISPNFTPIVRQLLAERGLPPSSWENHPDIWFTHSNSTISIKAIRELKNWVSRKPYQAPQKAAIILDAHTLTLPAQNALLKTLEEPPPDTIIILTAPNQNLLLGTIISRCQIITTPSGSSNSSEVNQETANLIEALPSLSPAERLSRVGEYTKSKDDAITFTESLLSALRQRYYPSPVHSWMIPTAQQLRLCVAAHKQLTANVNPKLVIENLFLNW